MANANAAWQSRYGAKVAVPRSLMPALAIVVALTLEPYPAAGQKAPNGAAARPAASSDFLRSLSEAERAWLRAHPVIRVAQDPSWPPIEFADALGTPSGMTADYLTLIEARLGLKFERVKNLSWQEAYARMKRWEIDMTTTVAVTQERETFWAFTKPYMTIPIVIVTRSDVTYIADLRELEGRKVAVVDGYVANTWITRDYPGIQLIRVGTAEEALRLLQRGEVFACVENMLVVGHYLAELDITNLKIAGSTPYTNAQAMAVRKDWAPLAGILDRALDSISQPERDSIYRRWLPVSYEARFDSTRLLPLASLVVIFLVGLAAWRWKRAGDLRDLLPGAGWLKPWQVDLLAISATAATFGFRLALDGQLGGQPTLVIFTLPIMLSAYLGGMRAGLLATAVAYVGASYYLLPPIQSFAVASGVQRWQLFFITVAGVFISGLSEVLHRARARAEIATRESQRSEAARRESDQQVRRLNAELEQRVVERTGQLEAANQELKAFSTAVSRDLLVAEAADRVKSTFLATMSHELRTPLNSIIGFTGIVLMGKAGPVNAEQEKQLGMVRESAWHLLALINDVLDISKIEAGQIEVRAEPFDLPASVERVLAMIGPQAQKKGLLLSADVAPTLNEMVSDRRRVEQILLNLLSNAVKFTDHGRVLLTAELLTDYQPSPSGPPGRAVRLRVTDTGVGIMPEDLPLLFQPFRQVDSGPARRSEGTGLGLAICRRLATLLGGEIAVASTWSQGTEFTVILPLRLASAQ